MLFSFNIVLKIRKILILAVKQSADGDKLHNTTGLTRDANSIHVIFTYYVLYMYIRNTYINNCRFYLNYLKSNNVGFSLGVLFHNS